MTKGLDYVIFEANKCYQYLYVSNIMSNTLQFLWLTASKRGVSYYAVLLSDCNNRI